MSRVLFVTWDGGGNVGPAVEIGRELQRRGDEVSFLGQDRQREYLEDAGFEFAAYRNPGSWTATDRRSGLKNAIGFLRLLVGRSLGRDLVAEASRAATDLVVVDCLLYGALNAAQRAGLHHAVLVHSLFGAVDGKMARGAPGLVARLTGLNPRKSWSRADSLVAVTLEEFDDLSRVRRAPELHYAGPVLPMAAQQQEGSASPAVETILVSLSTTYVAGQVEALQRILDAVAELPVRAVVTTGPAIDPASLRAPDNAELSRFVPHAQLMPTVSLVVGHGGHSTTMLALAHDLPLVILPMNSQFDQPLIARRIEQTGAGVRLPASSSAADIRAAIERVRADEAIRRGAARLGAAIRATRGTASAATLLQSLMPTNLPQVGAPAESGVDEPSR